MIAPETPRPCKMTSNVARLASFISKGHRWALSKGITLAESQNRAQQKQFSELMEHLSGRQMIVENDGCFRIGISGPPGAGKSSVIEALGLDMISKGHKVAVLAVDPSSVVSGGSILGDKTRMPQLAQHAFVRPSASGTALGGVNRAMLNSILLCSMASFDRVIIETVGVGQSELSVMNLVDVMVLIMPPVGGDELQMIKRGVTEFADIIVVNKADGSTMNAAVRMSNSIAGTLQLRLRRPGGWAPRVLLCSAHTGKGIEELNSTLDSFLEHITKDNSLHQARVSHASQLLWEAADFQLKDSFHSNPRVRQHIENTILPKVLAGEISVREAAIDLVEEFLSIDAH